MKTKKHNIITSILLQTLTKTSNAIQKKDIDLIQFLKDTLSLINNKLENEYRTLKMYPEQAKKEIKTLDNLVNALINLFSILFDILDANENKIIEPEYNKFLDNMNDYRDDLELFLNTEFWEETVRIYNGTYDRSQYTKYNSEKFLNGV